MAPRTHGSLSYRVCAQGGKELPPVISQHRSVDMSRDNKIASRRNEARELALCILLMALLLLTLI
jgi:hypothetical protein